MKWLQKRLDELEYTYDDINQLLQQAGLKQTLTKLSKGMNENSIMLSELKVLATVLKWSLLELLIASEFELEVEAEFIPIILDYNKFSQARKKLFLLTVQQLSRYADSLSEEDINRAIEETKSVV